MSDVRELSRLARLYITAVVLLGAAAACAAAVLTDWSLVAPGLTAVLLGGATLAQAFEVWSPGNKGYVATLSFLAAAALLLAPGPVALIAVAPFVIEQVRRPKPWYIQSFNASSHLLATLAAERAATLLAPPGGVLDGSTEGTAVALLSVLVLLVVNHATLVLVLWWARGVPPSESGLLSGEGVLVDSSLLALGVTMAALWQIGPALVPVALVPFGMMQRALWFSTLQDASRTEPKTGLANSTWWRTVAGRALESVSIERPVSVLVADLDHLRDVNTRHGHLIGDDVLLAVANSLRTHARPEDLVARFGGEEFLVLLPDTDLREARVIGERLRTAIAELEHTGADGQPFHVTVSMGLATAPLHATVLDDVLRIADLAAYRAKAEGRNRVCLPRPDDVTDAETLVTPPREVPVAPDRRRSTPIGRGAAGEGGRGEASRPERRVAAGGEPLPETAFRSRRTMPFTIVLAVVVAALAVLLPTQTLDREALWLFPLGALLAEAARTRLYASGAVSLSCLATLSAVAAGESSAALLAAAVAAVGGGMLVRRRPEQIAFNASAHVLAAMAALAVRSLVDLGSPTGSDAAQLAAIMAGASLAHFLVNNLLVSAVISLDERRPMLAVFRGELLWLAPHTLAFGLLASLVALSWTTFHLLSTLALVVPAALLRIAQRQYLSHTARSVRDLRLLATDLSSSQHALQGSNTALAHALQVVEDRHLATAKSLAKAIDARDSTTGGHVERVAAVGMALCGVVDPGLAADPQIAFGFLLHDVGKIGVPDRVLLKPGPLTSEEWAIMRRHPRIGAEILEQAGFSESARDLVLCHHERFDGAGYPRGLRGQEIPLTVRLFSIADSLDAMCNDRPYRAAMPLEEAYAEIHRHAGTQFDPMAVEALMTLDEHEVARLLRLTPRVLGDDDDQRLPPVLQRSPLQPQSTRRPV